MWKFLHRVGAVFLGFLFEDGKAAYGVGLALGYTFKYQFHNFSFSIFRSFNSAFSNCNNCNTVTL